MSEPADIVMFIHKPEEMQGVEHADQPVDYVAEIIFASIFEQSTVISSFIPLKKSELSILKKIITVEGSGF